MGQIRMCGGSPTSYAWGRYVCVGGLQLAMHGADTCMGGLQLAMHGPDIHGGVSD